MEGILNESRAVVWIQSLTETIHWDVVLLLPERSRPGRIWRRETYGLNDLSREHTYIETTLIKQWVRSFLKSTFLYTILKSYLHFFKTHALS